MQPGGTNSPNKSAGTKSFTILGHRGAMGHAPENTMPSFFKALELGANMFELDIHRSRDGVLVVMHDKTVDRTTDGTGKISEMTWEEIRRLDAGSWFSPEFAGARVPRLEEVFEALGGKIAIDIEVKAGDELYRGIIDALVDVINKYDIIEHVLITSFHEEYLIEARQKLPDAQVGLIYSRPRENVIAEAVRNGWQVLHPHLTLVNKEFVDEAHAHGLIVRPWNPNELEPMRRMIEMGVDGLSSDFPDRIATLAKEMGAI